MYEIEQFVQAVILLAVLTAVSFPHSAAPYPLMLVCGGFMLFFTSRGLSERSEWYTVPAQFLLCAAYIAVSGHMAACLIFYEFREKEKTGMRRPRAVRLVLPATAYLIVSSAAWLAAFALDKWKILGSIIQPHLAAAAGFSGFAETKEPAYILLGAILLFAAALFLALGETLAVRYILIKDETKQVVSMTALAELYQKKLNQELMMKNYLADKNARLEERENISRNIHNSVGHSVTAAVMALEAAELLLDADKEKAREKIQAANRRIRAGLDSIRQAVRILDEENTPLPVEDFLYRINELAENFMADTAIRVRIDASDLFPECRMNQEYAVFLTGAVSELLANGVRHGNADRFMIRLAADSTHIQVSVSDNGTGNFTAGNSKIKIENGYGLKKLISFAEKRGGSAVFENEHGFKSVITLPFYEKMEL